MFWTGRPLIRSGPDWDGIDGQEAVDAFLDGCFCFGIPGDGFFDEGFDEVGVLDARTRDSDHPRGGRLGCRLLELDVLLVVELDLVDQGASFRA